MLLDTSFRRCYNPSFGVQGEEGGQQLILNRVFKERERVAGFKPIYHLLTINESYVQTETNNNTIPPLREQCHDEEHHVALTRDRQRPQLCSPIWPTGPVCFHRCSFIAIHLIAEGLQVCLTSPMGRVVPGTEHKTAEEKHTRNTPSHKCKPSLLH